MDSIDRPRGLIRYDSMEGIKNKTKFKWTPRVIGYSLVLLILLSTITFLFAGRSDVDINILRTPGMLFQNQSENKVSNMYDLKISNKTFEELPLEMKLDAADGEIKLVGNEINLKALEIYEGKFLIILPRDKIKLLNTPMKINIYSGEKLIETINTTFLGPQN